MSIFFGTESGAYVNCGTNASVSTMSIGTMAGWVRVLAWSPVGNYFGIINKGNPNYSSYNALDIMPFSPNDGKLDCNINLSTTNWNLRSGDNDVRLGQWTFVAKTWNIATVAEDQYLYVGRLNSAVKEPSFYEIRDLGSGVQIPDNTMPLGIGNFGAPNPGEFYDGGSDREIHWVGMWPRQLSCGELDMVRRETMMRLVRPRGALLYTYLGLKDGGVQPDLSGNGLHGILGTTNSPSPRIGGNLIPPFKNEFSIISGATTGGVLPPPTKMDGMFFASI